MPSIEGNISIHAQFLTVYPAIRKVVAEAQSHQHRPSFGNGGETPHCRIAIGYCATVSEQNPYGIYG